MPRTSLAVAIAGLLLACSAIGVRAAALDPESCAKLKASLEELERAGARDNMAKGPDWAKANLPPDRLAEVRRLIETDEQLLFRCPGRHLVNLPLEPDPPPPPPPAEKADGEPKAETAKAVPPPKPAPAPDRKADDKAKGPAAKKPAAAKAAAADSKAPEKPQPKPKPAQKPRPKPKDDAFKPSPSDPNDPFGLN
ncbi:MAG: hypothetical protein NW223_14110 [Hyphomicrobiaceae bacterium]|nr:hypothetical protein [Hyphomicrobiaceae bacterium]